MQIRTPAKGKDEPYGKTLTTNYVMVGGRAPLYTALALRYVSMYLVCMLMFRRMSMVRHFVVWPERLASTQR